MPSQQQTTLKQTLHFLLLCSIMNTTSGSNDAKRLYDEKLRKGTYNKLLRPVSNTSDTLVVKLRLRLTQIIDVDEKNQIMTTNVWLEQSWYDSKLSWRPADYGQVNRLYVPSDDIWLPDIVLYNSADGNFTVKLMTKATVHHDGLVVWKPPAIYKSLCPIDVEFFPFDEQMCTLKFGSWSYDGFSVDIKHMDLKDEYKDLETVAEGVDLSDYYQSTEWDLLAVPAQKYQKFYTCCSEPYPDIKFNITIRRKTLFHTVNLILPCVAICSVTLLVFYIPANSGEKITMGITILNSLNIFLLLVAEINPPTSLATPLIGKYLLFTMVLVTCSIIVTVFVLNVHFRSPSTHVMSPWIQELFLNVLPKLLFMHRPRTEVRDASIDACSHMEEVPRTESFNPNQNHFTNRPQNLLPLNAAPSNFRGLASTNSYLRMNNSTLSTPISANFLPRDDLSPIRSLRSLRKETSFDRSFSQKGSEPKSDWTMSGSRSLYSRKKPIPDNVMQAVFGVNFIADHLKQQEEFNKVKQDWQFVAMVLDRLFLWMFTAACVVGTFGIIVQAPTLYDSRRPIVIGSTEE